MNFEDTRRLMERYSQSRKRLSRIKAVYTFAIFLVIAFVFFLIAYLLVFS